MIDIRLLRQDPAAVKANCVRRGATVDIDAIVRLDQEYLALIREVEDLRGERNRLSKDAKTDVAARERVKALKGILDEKEQRQTQVKAEVDKLLAWVPNWLSPECPSGASDADNQELRQWGTKPTFDFTARDHQTIGEQLGLIDTARGAKVAQAGFYYWCGAGAQLTQALFYWAQMELVKKGFTLFMTPCVAKGQTLFGTGYLPFFAEQTYGLVGQDLSLIGTSEQTLVAFHADEILPADKLPLKYTAYTPCFRTESGSYGKETRGIFRVHQFHKVEQIILCKPEESPACHELCLANEEYLLQQLGLPYRVVNVCTGDMGAPGYKKYDIEAWFAGYNGFREVTSNTNLTDFQARRLGIRFPDDKGQKQFVHTISATAVTDRVVCAILEHYQQADGRVIVPEVLRPFTGFAEIVPPKK